MDRRFTSDSIMAIKCLGIIPSCFASSEKADDDEMLEFFKDDTCFDSTVKTKLQLWHAYCTLKKKSCLKHHNLLCSVLIL